MDHLIPNLNRDLLQQVEPKKQPLFRGFWTLLITEVIAVASAAFAGFFWRGFISGNNGLLIPALLSILFLAVSALAAMFGTSRTRRAIIMLLEAGAFLLAWGPQDLAYLGPALSAILVFSVWGDSSLREELSNRVKVKLIPMTRMKIGHTFTGFLLAGLILTIPIWKGSSLPLPERQFRSLYETAVKMAVVINPDIKMDSSIQELAASIARKQLMANEDFAALPPDAQEEEIAIATESLIKQAEGGLKMSVGRDSSSADIFYRYLSNVFAGWQQSFGEAFFLFLALGLFIFLRGIGIILAWVTMLVSVVIFEVLSTLGIVAVIGEPAMQEKVALVKG